jgi:hypothetical protein
MAQMVEVTVRDRGQALQLGRARTLEIRAPECAAWPGAQALMGFIDLGQQLDVGAGVALWEAMAMAALHP